MLADTWADVDKLLSIMHCFSLVTYLLMQNNAAEEKKDDSICG